MTKPEHLVLINVVGLSPRHLEKRDLTPNLSALAERGQALPMKPSFPAVTCSVQATLLSGKPPSEHGIIANGYFDRETYEVKFWEQPDALVQAPRLWDQLKANRPDLKTAVLFWQNSMYINSDIVVTPRPLHLDSGMVQWCYSKPDGFYERLAGTIGNFKLQHYWGPVAGLGSSQWITNAAIQTWHFHRPDVMLVYLPHLDYASQKFGPDAPESLQAVREVDGLVGQLLREVGDSAAVAVCSEYSLSPVRGALYPNRILRDAGLLRVREIGGKEYLDFELSDAFAMVDHQIAHIYCKPDAVEAARSAIERGTDGAVEFTSIHHPRSGELVIVAPQDKWFAYYWWKNWHVAPEFAFTVDIHRKPGYDPCELWFDWKKFVSTWKLPTTATTPELVRGSHGRLPKGNDNWATLILDETLAGLYAANGDHANATDVAPLIVGALAG
jgi:predicted AlkP superfamily pyrophosphatase or phosphodiesterase